MKHLKRFAALALTLLLVTLACVPAWAAEPEDSGMYNITGDVISAIRNANGAAVAKTQADGYTGDYYSGAERFTVTCPGVEAGKEYVVFVVKGDGAPSDANIVYINQQTAGSDGKVVFDNVFPSNLLEGQYKVYVTGAGKTLDTPLATFLYHLAKSFALKLTFMGIDPKDVTITLLRNQVNVDAENAASGSVVTFPKVAGGSYLLKVVDKAGECVPFANDLDLTAADLEVNVPLVFPGDLNGAAESNGKRVGTGDMQALFEYLSGDKSTSQIYTANRAYFISACDVNGDRNVDILDYQALYEKIQKSLAAG